VTPSPTSSVPDAEPDAGQDAGRGRRGRRDLRRPERDLGFAAALWRAVDVFRGVAAVYAVVAYATREEPYRNPVLGWVVLAVMAAWSVWVWRAPRRSVALLVTDLALACAAVLATLAVDTAQTAAATNTLPLVWPAAAVLSWAVWRGPVTGVIAALAVGAADLVVLDPVDRPALHNIVLLLLAGAVVGFAAELYERTRRELAVAVEQAAAARERERLARDIHDSVLQVLAYVQRRAGELGGEAGQLGRMAGEQEVRLRSLVSGRPRPAAGPGAAGGSGAAAEADLLAALQALQASTVTVSGPAQPVPLPGGAVEDLAAAVAACLDNVRRHAGEGARAWVLVDDEGDAVVVSVRDDGRGFDAGRLAQAEEDGRMGVSLSVRGRVAEHGGTTSVWSRPGEGTEVEMRVPRPPGRARGAS
jgi:signal transduction histidine kinase